jgi:hypothetical protein
VPLLSSLCPPPDSPSVWTMPTWGSHQGEGAAALPSPAQQQATQTPLQPPAHPWVTVFNNERGHHDVSTVVVHV